MVSREASRLCLTFCGYCSRDGEGGITLLESVETERSFNGLVGRETGPEGTYGAQCVCGHRVCEDQVYA